MKNLNKIFQLFAFVLALGLSSCGNDDDNSNTPVPEPVASFTVANGGCVGPCTVTFTNTSENATTYVWDFGDNTPTSTLANPTHQYTSAGTYTVTLTAASATETHSTSQSVTITEPAFYITYKANGTAVSLTDVYGERETVSGEKRLIVRGTGPAGAHPTFKFYATEVFGGFDPGLNIPVDANKMPDYYFQISNSAGTVFSTANDSDGIHAFFQETSYTNGGITRGTFTGTVKTSAGEVLTITDGRFRVKFNN